MNQTKYSQCRQEPDLVTALKQHENNAAGSSSDFAKGYLMAIRHAIELAEVIQRRNQQDTKATS